MFLDPKKTINLKRLIKSHINLYKFLNMEFKLFITCVFFGIITSCQKSIEHVELSGKIINPKSEIIKISNKLGYKKTIKINDDGFFKDTLKVPSEGRYRFSDGFETGQIFLKNGNTTHLSLNTEAFDETLKFSGDDSDKSNFIIENILIQEKYLSMSIFDNSIEIFEKTFDSIDEEIKLLKKGYKNIESSYFEEDDDNFKNLKEIYTNYFHEKNYIRNVLGKGTKSPTFENFENFNGGTTSLEDLIGSYIYIDIWATWCGPCKKEIPFLKEIESKYSNKNIKFVSISVDDAKRNGSTEKAKNSWRKMVSDKNLKGIQLFSDNGWETKFIKDYKVTGIPRFILINREGKIIDADAPRPSSSKLINLIDSLEI